MHGYFHLVKHSPSFTISLFVKNNRVTAGERVRKNEREREASCKQDNSKIKKNSFKQLRQIFNLLPFKCRQRDRHK